MTKILVVEDVLLQLKLVSGILTGFGYEVLAVRTGLDGLAAVQYFEPDLILLDVMLPDVDGIGVCRRLKADPLTCSIPVIMLSARDCEEDIIRGLDTGAQDYVTKPFNEKILLARVRSAVRAKSDYDMIVALNRRLVDLASIDGLTGAKNRAYLQGALTQALSLARRQELPLTLAILDVDRFKAHNDTFGHLAGDEILRRLVKILTGGLRAHDVVARYGGEEFVVLMPATGVDDGLAVSERLRASVAVGPWEHWAVTVSFGVATSVSGNDSPEGLIERADRALYYAKRTGRDRVVHDRHVISRVQVATEL